MTDDPAASRVSEWCSRNWLRHCGKLMPVSRRKSLPQLVQGDALQVVPLPRRALRRPQGVLAVLCFVPPVAVLLGLFLPEPGLPEPERA